jgi:RimJ/RimL family protein N-acetyltransferase
VLCLKLATFPDVHSHFVDFQKRSRCFEMPPEESDVIGVYKQDEMIGYFIIQEHSPIEISINQGYLKKQYRHHNLPNECMQLFENMCKRVGYKTVWLQTHNRFNSYMKFAKNLGYKPYKLVFKKEL